MELWIRSQDKTFLMKIDNINLGIGVDSKKPCRLFTFVGGVVTSFTLGTYKSEERALEVLDEIQNILKPRIIYKQNEPIETILDGIYYLKQNVDMKIQEVSTDVYIMPKD